MAEVLTPTDALEFKCRIVNTIRRLRDTVGPFAPDYPTLADYHDDLMMFSQATPTIWTVPMLTLLAQAAATFPWTDPIACVAMAARRPPLPPTGLLHLFETPWLGIVPLKGEGTFTGGPTDPLLGVMQMPVRRATTNQLRIVYRGLSGNATICMPALYWEIGDEYDGMAGLDAVTRSEMQVITRWALIAWLFMNEVIEAQPVPVERHARKRAERLEVATLVHTVTLRKAIAGVLPPAPAGTSLVEWQCRWLVRGHWRQQWHPRMQAHVPTWIAPHIKGPDDQPLKTPAPEVWRVSR